MQIQIVLFYLNDVKYGVPLGSVERVVPALTVNSLPNAPEIILGAVNLHGDIIPVINLRERFRLPAKDIDPDDKLIIAHTGHRPVAFLVDEVEGVVGFDDSKIIDGEKIFPDMPYVKGVLGTDDGMIIINDISLFLSLDEESKLSMALG